MKTAKIIIGIILVIASFAYIIKNPSQSMMDGLMKKRKEMYDKELARAAEADNDETAQSADESSEKMQQ
ncbi:MAG: hypothetical protein MR328_03000 [Firmicutes bacterium]|nr:hypothetical protein [Bacillota bacterium]